MNSRQTPDTVLLDFSNSVPQTNWRAIDDEVMGGRSNSAPDIANGCLHFSGVLSLENNGGFASIRAHHQQDLSKLHGVMLCACGDGRRYQFRLYTDASYQGSRIAYSFGFDTVEGQWLEIPIPFSGLKPVFRGRNLPGPVFDAAKVEQIGFLLADKQVGSFHLAVAWIAEL
ncbi:MAG: CIA30 family protein [Pseudomonadota bacterium]|nr:CIA30 family protein [Pseudomonadota bacterium]